jgi:acyl-CoA hydrolase
MKTARLQVLTTPAFRDWLRKEARNAGVSVAELVRTRCEHKPTGEEQAVAKLASHLHKAVRKAQVSLRSGLAEANAVLDELRKERERRHRAVSR